MLPIRRSWGSSRPGSEGVVRGVTVVDRTGDARYTADADVGGVVYAVHMLTDLRDGRAGTAVLPDDEGWGENPPIYVAPGNPSAVVRPETPQQVGEALRLAAAEGVGVTIRSGGHGGRLFDNDGCLVIELSNFRGVEVAASKNGGTTVRVGAGAIWGDVARQLAFHDLGITSGDTKSVGVGGLTLGGGVGWMVREYGLAIDSLIGATVVLPSGEVVHASTDENPDLFWALRGGGGNFGVVTTFEFEAHPLDGVVFGSLTYEVDAAAQVVTGWRDVMRGAPEQFNSTFMAMPAMGPGMEPSVQVIVFHPGRNVEVVEPLLVKLRALPGYLSEDIAAKDYADALEDAHPFEGPMPVITGDTAFVDDLSDAAIDTVVGVHHSVAGILVLRYLRGAFNRVDPDATAWGHRGAEVMVMVAAFLPPGSPREQIDAIHAKWAPAQEYADGTYGNFAQEIGDDVIALMYPPATLKRLRELKRRYDPQNLLSRNQNIVP
jgi:FAD/FMN-containing dehydrogenase